MGHNSGYFDIIVSEPNTVQTRTNVLDVAMVCSGIAKNAKNACAKSLGTVHDVYNEGEPSVGLFV